MNIKTVIIDDEPRAIDVLRRYCGETERIDLQASFRDPVRALDYLQSHSVDLIFLDINMPRLSGIEFLNLLQPPPKVIFTTAYAKYALDSYNYDAVDYLLKPISFQRFLKAVGKMRHRLPPAAAPRPEATSPGHQTIFIKSGALLHKLHLEEILFLEKDGNYLIFHTADKKILSRQNLRDVFDILDPEAFIRVHKSYVVAKRHVDIIEAEQLRIGKVKIPIGRNYRSAVDQMIRDG